MNRHYEHCTNPECIVCESYREIRNTEALYRLIDYRQRDPSQEQLTTYE